MFYLVAPQQSIIGDYKTRSAAEAERQSREGVDRRYPFLIVLEARNDIEARQKDKALREFYEKQTGKSWNK